jgi:hypothetical protein
MCLSRQIKGHNPSKIDALFLQNEGSKDELAACLSGGRVITLGSRSTHLKPAVLVNGNKASGG